MCNVYYDTPLYVLARRSLEKPVYKEKLRLRSYGSANHDSVVFVELKKKYRSVVYKRRIGARETEAEAYLCQGKPLSESNQITEELDYFRSLYPNLLPVVFLSYRREAFCVRGDHDVRITFDEDILWREKELSLCTEPFGEPILKEGQTLMEIKTPGAIPLWIAKLLSENRVYKTSFSKYGNAYLTARKRGEFIQEGLFGDLEMQAGQERQREGGMMGGETYA